MDVITYALSKKYIQKCLDGLGVLKGANCIIESVTPVSEGNQITFSWTGTSGAKETTTILVKNGEQGNGIVKVEKIKTIGLVDTYRMTFDDGSTFEYEVTNGSNSGGGTSTWSEVNNKPFETIGSDFTVVNNELKLADGIDGKIDTIKVNGVELPIVDKAVDIAVPSIDGLTKDSDLSIVAKSGSYNDLTDTPAIPSIEGLAKTEDIPTKVSDLENDSNYLSSVPEEYITDTELEAKGYLTEHQDISGKVDKVEGKSLIADTEIARLASVDNYDDTDIRAEITKKADAASIPSKVSNLENDSKYQTESDITTTLTNYATQTYVGEQIANAEHLKREIVTVIPSNEEASDNVIYMLKVESTTGNDKYQEYMKIDGTVQMVGDTSVDLTDYAKIDDIPTTVAELTDSADYAKKTDVNDSISTLQINKADASDLTAHTDNTNIHVTTADKSKWNSKLDSNQGTSNAGKLLGTNSSGDVVAIQGYGFEYNEETKMLEYGTDPTTNLNQGIGLDDTLSKSGYAAEASAVGELKSDLENYANDLICYFEWVNGSFDGTYYSAGGAYTNNDTRYMIMRDFVQATDDIYVYCKDTTKYNYICYNLKDSGITKYANNETIYANEDYISTSNKKFLMIPKGTYFRIECKFADNHIPNENEKYELKYATILGNNLGNSLIMAEKNVKKIFTVGRDNCDFEKLSDALAYAVSVGNCELHLASQVFNIIDEVGDISIYGSGLNIGNNVHIIGKNGTLIRCNYTGDDGLVQRNFSIFNALPSDFTIENVRIEAFNVRYCVHDECSGTNTPYTHKYIHCDMYHDSHNAHWRTSQCIGGGFGTNGTCIVDGGVYETVAQYESTTYDMDGSYTEELRADVISWHSNNSNESAKNTLIIKNIFGDGSLSRVKYSAGSDGLVLISNNSFGRTPSPYSVTPRSYIWNNEIRSN